MYWAKNPDGTYELLDGKQRTLSFCKYIDGSFSVDMTGNEDVRYFHDLLPDEQRKILDYKLTIYVCEGIKLTIAKNLQCDQDNSRNICKLIAEGRRNSNERYPKN